MSKQRISICEPPKVSFDAARRSWFTYAGHVYAVSLAPSAVFRAAILKRAPAWRSHSDYGHILDQKELDEYDRWYLICGLTEIGKSLTLYESREQAAGKVS